MRGESQRNHINQRANQEGTASIRERIWNYINQKTNRKNQEKPKEITSTEERNPRYLRRRRGQT